MKNIYLNFTALIICFSLGINIFASDHDMNKPTREQIAELLDEYQNHHPLTEAEKQIGFYRREKVNLVQRLGTDFSGIDLSEMNFRSIERGVSAPKTNFSQCNMRGVFFYGAVLTDCDFTNTDLTDAKFWFCEFQNTNFSQAKLNNTEFAYCEMQNVQFSGLDAGTSRFEAVHFSHAKLMGTNFSGAKFVHRNNFANADLSGANLSNTNLSGDDFQNANMKAVGFRNTDLRFADFTGANLKVAIFANVQGINENQYKSLESQTGRWWYDIKQSFYHILQVVYCPVYLLVVISVVIFSVLGLLQKDKKTLSFVIGLFSNGFAVFSTLCTFGMMFSGGHPVRQMSQGNYDAWSSWLHFFPIPMFGLMICILIAGILSLILFSRLFSKDAKQRPWKILFYQILALVHCLLAFNWLIIFMPDA